VSVRSRTSCSGTVNTGKCQDYEASTCVNTHIIAALNSTEPFSALKHVATIKEVRTELTGRKRSTDDSSSSESSSSSHSILPVEAANLFSASACSRSSSMSPNRAASKKFSQRPSVFIHSWTTSDRLGQTGHDRGPCVPSYKRIRETHVRFRGNRRYCSLAPLPFLSYAVENLKRKISPYHTIPYVR
jgi:hypothetical protein